MTLSIDDVKTLVSTYQKESTLLYSQLVPVPESFMMPCDGDEDEPAETVAHYVKSINLKDMPEEAIAMHEKLVADLERFGRIVNNKVHEAAQFNDGIYAKNNQLHDELMAKIQTIPEFQFNGCIVINKKHIHPDDFDAFIAIYKDLGFSHYVIKSASDLLYYSRTTDHFNSIKERFIEEMPKSLRKRYPTILNYMQNSWIQTSPLHGDDLYKVMAARQA